LEFSEMAKINFQYEGGTRTGKIRNALKKVVNYIERITGKEIKDITVTNWKTSDSNNLAQANPADRTIQINSAREGQVSNVVVAHELLHVLGFDHEPFRPRFSIMSERAPQRLWKDVLGPTDVAGLKPKDGKWQVNKDDDVYKPMQYGDRKDGKVYGIVIVDGGGKDTIDISSGRGSTSDLVIDLRPTIDHDSSNFSYIVGSSKTPLFAIAKGVVIENAIGGSGSDSLSGNDADNMLEGCAGDDKLNGFGGDDSLYGDAGEDWLIGEDGDDNLYGGDGDDRLVGGDGDDRLKGEDGNDTLMGGNDRDWIYGGEGDDQLSGGPGSDVFVYLSSGFGHDVVTDFERSDKLSFSRSIFADWKSLMSRTEEVGTDLVISRTRFDDITLKHVSLADFRPENVIFTN
jgi:RTX calcium-binding nonapeptide repeat (4 copies)